LNKSIKDITVDDIKRSMLFMQGKKLTDEQKIKMIKIYNKDTNFEEEIKEGKVIIDFFATWCGPCRMIGNVLEEISKEQEDIKILKIDVDEYDELAYQFQVMSIPTIVFYKDGKIINKKVGFCNKKELLGYFN
jgi:thioredoxin 1